MRSIHKSRGKLQPNYVRERAQFSHGHKMRPLSKNISRMKSSLSIPTY